MRDIIERFLELVRHEGPGPTIEVEIEGDIFDGLLTGEMAEIVNEMREAVALGDEDAN